MDGREDAETRPIGDKKPPKGNADSVEHAEGLAVAARRD